MMKRDTKYIAFLACVMMSVSGANAATCNWTNSLGGDFHTAANWDTGVPVSGDTANFNLNASYTITFSGHATNGVNNFNAVDADVTLDIGDGNVWTNTALFKIADGAGRTNKLTVKSGTINHQPAGNSCLGGSGNGTLIVTNTGAFNWLPGIPSISGGFTFAHFGGFAAGGRCTFKMHGGTYSVGNALATAFNAANTGTVVITGGLFDGSLNLGGAETTMTMSGGTFTNGTLTVGTNADCRITGGTVMADDITISGSLTVSGGTVTRSSGNNWSPAGLLTLVGTNGAVVIDCWSAPKGTHRFLFADGGASPIRNIDTQFGIYLANNSPTLDLGLNGYMSSITTNEMTLLDCVKGDASDYPNKNLSIFTAGRKAGDNSQYVAQLDPLYKVAASDLQLNAGLAIMTATNVGYIGIDNSGMSGTVDVHVRMDYTGASKTQSELITAMSEAGLTVSETSYAGSDWVTIATPAPTWSDPAFAWDLSTFDVNVEVEALAVGELPTTGSVFRFQ